MIKYNLVDSMIGNVYTFFINNNKIMEDPSYYVYEIVSPKLSPDLIPYLTLQKISERTKVGNSKEPYGKGIDLITVCNSNQSKVSPKDLISSILWKDNPIVDEDGENFPLIEMENGNNIQKSVIVGLRDMLRWKNYKLLPGNFVDILWTPTTFMLFKICGDKNEVWIEPVGLFKNSDSNLKNPLNIDYQRIDYSKNKWSTSKGKLSEFNKILKKLEWESFGRKELI